MMITVCFFSDLREKLQLDTVQLEVSVETVLEVWNEATQNRPLPVNLLCAVNQEMCNINQVISNGDEVAFFPPVSGG